jgi:acetylornithine deacetylase/succinyl-diaminopimelate desuccinylase-like protein
MPAPPATTGSDVVAAVRASVSAQREGFVTALLDWLHIPSISGDPAHAPDVRRSADWLAATLRSTGFPDVEVWETGGHPAVYAEWPAAEADAPTVLVYGHHDVQPVDPIEAWETTPFEPFLRQGPHGEQVVGRGACDDKGHVLFHTMGVRAHLEATGRTSPAVTLKVLVEGEEESGSMHFPQLLRRERGRLRCDAVVVSDTGMWGYDTPTTCTAMRGLTDAQVDFSGPEVDLHSGRFGGGVRNPLTELCRLLAALHDERGRVQVPGFYDDVVAVSDRERQLFAALPFDEEEWLEMATSREAWGEQGFTTLERIWARPTAEVNGIWGGYTGAGGKTIVPTDAHAKLSFRLVADQDPATVQQQVRAFVADRVPAGIRWEVTFDGAGVRPCLTPLGAPALQGVVRSMSAAFDQEVTYTREGGSGPEADLQDVLGVPVVFLGVGLSDDRIHAPNEKAELDLLVKGAEAAAYLWSDLATSLRP